MTRTSEIGMRRFISEIWVSKENKQQPAHTREAYEGDGKTKGVSGFMI